jgi:hypothetical protein
VKKIPCKDCKHCVYYSGDYFHLFCDEKASYYLWKSPITGAKLRRVDKVYSFRWSLWLKRLFCNAEPKGEIDEA